MAAAGHCLSALYVLALHLGLRRGEVLGLRWQDVDLEEAKLEVVCARTARDICPAAGSSTSTPE